MTPPHRALLRDRIEAVLRAEAGAVSVHRLCPRCGSSGHGVPGVRVAAGDPPYVSMAYAARLAAVAWSPAGPVGIDLEETGPDVGEFGDRLAWTRTEALLKATGRGVHALGGPVPDLPTHPLDLPPGHVGTLVGTEVTWRLVRG